MFSGGQPEKSSFDLGRQGYESWPFNFGLQWNRIADKAAVGGIELAKPEVLMLANWCSPYFEPEEAELMEDLVEQIDWQSLHRILNVCMTVANRQDTWKFKKEKVEAFEDTPAIPPPGEPAQVDRVAPEPGPGRSSRVQGPEGVWEERSDAARLTKAGKPDRRYGLRVRKKPVLQSQAVRPSGPTAPSDSSG